MRVFVGYLATALIITFCIPLFGLLMELVIKTMYGLVARILGKKVAFFLFNRLTFLGVFHHELSHALLATVTGAKVKKIVFFKPEGDRLGYVEYSTRGNVFIRSIQNTMSSIAPVFCGALSVFGLIYVLCMIELQVWLFILILYAIVSIVIHMTMSGQDFKVMWKGIPVCYLIVLAVIAIFQFRIF